MKRTGWGKQIKEAKEAARKAGIVDPAEYVATRFGVSKSTVRSWEKRTEPPRNYTPQKARAVARKAETETPRQTWGDLIETVIETERARGSKSPVSDAAKRLGVSRHVVRRWRQRNTTPDDEALAKYRRAVSNVFKKPPPAKDAAVPVPWETVFSDEINAQWFELWDKLTSETEYLKKRYPLSFSLHITDAGAEVAKEQWKVTTEGGREGALSQFWIQFRSFVNRYGSTYSFAIENVSAFVPEMEGFEPEEEEDEDEDEFGGWLVVGPPKKDVFGRFVEMPPSYYKALPRDARGRFAKRKGAGGE